MLDVLTSLTARPGNHGALLVGAAGFRCPNLLRRKPAGNEAMITAVRRSRPRE